MGIEAETVVEALTNAHRIRPERYTILDTGLSRDAAMKAAETTGII
jgi:glycerol-1-phosphate dehydrogenase [NAD(P)+]